MNVVIAGAAGVLIGVFFYGGLWLTVRALATTSHPALLTIGSFWIRTAISILALYFVMGDDWRKALTWLVGFACGRVVVSLFLPAAGGKPQCT